MSDKMKIVEANEICYTENSSSESYCAAVNEKLADGWSLFGPREVDKGWIKQYYVKINKSKTTIKE